MKKPFDEGIAPYLFNIGDKVVFGKQSWPGVIVKRYRKIDHLILSILNIKRKLNFYVVEQHGFTSGNVPVFDDEEKYLTSYITQKPNGSVDYQSDELEADFLDKNGTILLTVKSGQIGLAHKIVSSQLIVNN